MISLVCQSLLLLKLLTYFEKYGWKIHEDISFNLASNVTKRNFMVINSNSSLDIQFYIYGTLIFIILHISDNRTSFANAFVI